VGCPLHSWPKFLQALHVILQASVVTFRACNYSLFRVSSLLKPFTQLYRQPSLSQLYFGFFSQNQIHSQQHIQVHTSFFVTISQHFSHHPFEAWSNISVHVLNAVFALFEILFSNSPPAPWFTLLFNALFLAAYLGVAYITYATQGFYGAYPPFPFSFCNLIHSLSPLAVYAFLNPSKQHGKLAAYIIGIFLGQVIIFSIVRGIVVLRERWAWKSGRVLNLGGGFGEDGVTREVGTDDDEWEEIRRSSEPANLEAEKTTERMA